MSVNIVAIAGSSSPHSYNKRLLEFMQQHFADDDIRVISTRGLPMFSEDDPLPESVKEIGEAIAAADAVIIAAAEYNHSLTSSLKSLLEWLSSDVHPLTGKPVFLIGASTHAQGGARAQIHLRDILLSPGVQAEVFQDEEFFLGDVRNAFDDQGNLMDEGTVKFLEKCYHEFLAYAKTVNQVKGGQADA
ncbi:NADPH-dependent FMN reductase [Limosilactobacillus difficilis]|uniref:NADPH-dependent FMN reductase n=1 Tax=Limosilactobacillus difficilis TaxID=2991838 RepID=UPI0038CBFC1D